MSLLQLTPNSKLLDYIYYQNVMKLKNSELIIGLNNALININTGGSRNMQSSTGSVPNTSFGT